MTTMTPSPLVFWQPVAAAAPHQQRIDRAPRPVQRSHFDLDGGMQVEEMPWLHWLTLRLGETMLGLSAMAVGYELWSVGRDLLTAASSFGLAS